MSNILKIADLTDHAIRRAVFAMLDGLAHVVPARLQRMQERDDASYQQAQGPRGMHTSGFNPARKPRMKKLLALLVVASLAAVCENAYGENLETLRQLANEGNAKAQIDLGLMYANGHGVPQDHAEAVKWYRKAADQGDDVAQFYLGLMYANGHGVPQDHAEAVKWYRKAADQGNAKAWTNLGVMYEQGHGAPRDYAEAVKWYRKAADQGRAIAQNNLGVMYKRGHGVPQDYAEAVKWYRKAADQGLAIAQNNLGFMYEGGHGVPRDYAEALRWYRKAADQGNAEAQDNLQKLAAAAPCAEATVPTSAQEPKRFIGADLFIDLQEYVCKQVILTDGEVFGAHDKGGLIKAGGITFSMSVEDIDRESFRFFLTNCTGLPQPRPKGAPRCDVPLFVTPTGKYSVGPVLKSVKIAR
jgi:TPR repeat protein